MSEDLAVTGIIVNGGSSVTLSSTEDEVHLGGQSSTAKQLLLVFNKTVTLMPGGASSPPVPRSMSALSTARTAFSSITKQFRQWHPKRLGDPSQVQNRDVPFPTFDRADERTVQLARLAELRLRHAAALTEIPDGRAYLLQKLLMNSSSLLASANGLGTGADGRARSLALDVDCHGGGSFRVRVARPVCGGRRARGPVALGEC